MNAWASWIPPNGPQYRSSRGSKTNADSRTSSCTIGSVPIRDIRRKVKLLLNPQLGIGYTSASQIARRTTEQWGAENLYCLACSSRTLEPAVANTAVLDFRCPRCATIYQLKAKNGRFGRKVTNSAYEVKVAAIDDGRVPNYMFLGYSRTDWMVRDLFIVPGHFVTRAVVEARAPLRATARRAGWIGSNILLHALAAEARLELVAAGQITPPSTARRRWREFAFLRADPRARGGWAAEVLSCVRELQERGSNDFTLGEFYSAHEERLGQLHPDNRNVRAKMRQQLQVLRDGGVLAFLGQGRYRIIG